MSKSQLKTTCEGIFTSKVLYCLPLFSNVWGVMNMDDTALTKEDMRKLQVLQNKVLRLKPGNHELNVPTTELLEATNE